MHWSFCYINSLHDGYFFHCFCRSKSIYPKIPFRNTLRISNRLDPDQPRQNVGPGPGPNCSQRLSTNDNHRLRVKSVKVNMIGAGLMLLNILLTRTEVLFLINIANYR